LMLDGFQRRLQSSERLTPFLDPESKGMSEDQSIFVASNTPELCLGTLTFGWASAATPVDDESAVAMLKEFVQHGGRVIDTARCYSDGAAEEMLGRCLSQTGEAQTLQIDTKANPFHLHGLSPGGLRTQVVDSLAALRVPAVQILYLHQPDVKADLRATLACVHDLVQEGLVRELGLSNYSAVETQRCLDMCAANGWTAPTIYQGVFNAVNRGIEDKLLPVLRAARPPIRFRAYSPLAGGLLAKEQLRDNLPPKRLADNPFYFNDACLEANAGLVRACAEAGISLLQANYAWLLYHSVLGPRDGIVLGASSVSQLRANLTACSAAEPLPTALAEAFDACGEGCRATAYPFWRLYSQDMPGREDLCRDEPGALFHC
jgi:aflatoxin B1 aldehyde reductase